MQEQRMANTKPRDGERETKGWRTRDQGMANARPRDGERENDGWRRWD